MSPSFSPIGIFDSGVGGLSILRAVQRTLPGEEIIFLADQIHVPYGPRSLEEVRQFAFGITEYLLEEGAKLIVVACNAASAAALHDLRRSFPEIPFVGMEPAVKPAAEQTQTGVVGVLATPATFQGALYASVIERFANGVTVLQDTCSGLVAQIEAGELDGHETHHILKDALNPMLEQGIDTVVLGCTHYPFVIPLIQEITGPKVRVIDPAPAVARQVMRRLETSEQLNQEPGRKLTRFLTTGAPDQLQHLLTKFIGIQAAVTPLYWDGIKLKVRPGSPA
jgi:glutamate racemase